MIVKRLRRAVAAMTLAAALAGFVPAAHAQEAASVSVSIKNHRFQPAEVRAPANRPLLLHVRNLDATAMEFESVTLRVEKVVAANGEGVIRLRPLAPGRYKFFDDFNQAAMGVLVVE
jgi:hypothetical protein